MISLLRKNTLKKNLMWRPYFLFAQKSNTQFHKAVLSSNIIKTIRRSPLNEYRSQTYPSLKETILEQINSYQANYGHGPDTILIKKAAEEVRNYFEEGVWIPSDMDNKSSFLRETKSYHNIQKINGQIQINVDDMTEEELHNENFLKLLFCPTYVTTGQIFHVNITFAIFTISLLVLSRFHRQTLIIMISTIFSQVLLKLLKIICLIMIGMIDGV